MRFLGEDGNTDLPAYPFYKEQDTPEKATHYDLPEVWRGLSFCPMLFADEGNGPEQFPKKLFGWERKIYAAEIFEYELQGDASHGIHFSGSVQKLGEQRGALKC